MHDVVTAPRVGDRAQLPCGATVIVTAVGDDCVRWLPQDAHRDQPPACVPLAQWARTVRARDGQLDGLGR